MTAAGWFVMIFSVGGVTAFFIWTLFLVLTRKPSETEHLHSVIHDVPPDIISEEKENR